MFDHHGYGLEACPNNLREYCRNIPSSGLTFCFTLMSGAFTKTMTSRLYFNFFDKDSVAIYCTDLRYFQLENFYQQYSNFVF